MTETERRRWGKAGQRLTPVPAREGLAKAAERQAHVRRLDETYRLWRAGGVVPYSITFALDQCNLYGPEVDRACGVEEPAVDLWEAGKLYPTWRQLLALSDLTHYPVGFFTKRWEEAPLTGNSLRFHMAPEKWAQLERDWATRVLHADLGAVHAVTVGAPERRPA